MAPFYGKTKGIQFFFWPKNNWCHVKVDFNWRGLCNATNTSNSLVGLECGNTYHWDGHHHLEHQQKHETWWPLNDFLAIYIFYKCWDNVTVESLSFTLNQQLFSGFPSYLVMSHRNLGQNPSENPESLWVSQDMLNQLWPINHWLNINMAKWRKMAIQPCIPHWFFKHMFWFWLFLYVLLFFFWIMMLTSILDAGKNPTRLQQVKKTISRICFEFLPKSSWNFSTTQFLLEDLTSRIC